MKTLSQRCTLRHHITLFVADDSRLEKRRQLHVHVVQNQTLRPRRMDEIANLQVFAGQQTGEKHVQIRNAVQQRSYFLHEIVYRVDGISGSYGSFRITAITTQKWRELELV